MDADDEILDESHARPGIPVKDILRPKRHSVANSRYAQLSVPTHVFGNKNKYHLSFSDINF